MEKNVTNYVTHLLKDAFGLGKKTCPELGELSTEGEASR